MQLIYYLSRRRRLFVVTEELAEGHLHGLEGLRRMVEINDYSKRQLLGLKIGKVNAIGGEVNSSALSQKRDSRRPPLGSESASCMRLLKVRLLHRRQPIKKLRSLQRLSHTCVARWATILLLSLEGRTCPG